MGARKSKKTGDDELDTPDASVSSKPCLGGWRGAGARKMRLERIRKEIEEGTYETEGKLRIAISRLIDDALGRFGKRRG